MKKDEMTARIADYLDNHLTKGQRAAFEEHMAESDSFSKEVEDYRTLLEAIRKEEKQLPSASLETNFLKMLNEEKASQAKTVSITPTQNHWIKTMMKVAASIAILLSLFYLGRYSKTKESQNRLQIVENETAEIKQMVVLAMMENQSANKRVQGVQFVEELTETDPAVIKALANRLQFDENTTVRMAALEALSNFSGSEIVKKVFLETLENEKNPSIQIALIQNLVKMREKKAIGPMKKLLEQDDTQPFIKNEINQALPKII